MIITVSSPAFGDDLAVTSFSSFAGQTNILLQATGNITFGGGSLTLPALPPGVSTGQLLVEAGNDIIIQDGAGISAGQGWSVSFLSGNNVTFGTGGFVTTTDPAAFVTIQAGGTIFTGGQTPITGGSLPVIGAGTVTIVDGGTISIPESGQLITVTNLGSMPIQPQAQLILLNSQINDTNLMTVAGTNVLFLDVVDDFAACHFQWFKNRRRVPGETNFFLSLTNLRLHDAGIYSVVASNPAGRTTSNVQMYVLPQQPWRPLRGAEHRQVHCSNQQQTRPRNTH